MAQDVPVRSERGATKVSNEWVKQKGYERSKEPVLPGVWKLRQGGFLIRGRIKSDKTGRMLEVMRSVDAPSAARARVLLEEELLALKAGPAKPTSRIRFHEFATSLYEERVLGGEIRSVSTRKGWEGILRDHLLKPYPEGFGDMFLDAITISDVTEWRKRCARLLALGPCIPCEGRGWVMRGTQRRQCAPCKGKGERSYNPRTINLWIGKLQVITAAAAERKLIPEDVAVHLKHFPTDTHQTYTEEEPNSLTPQEAVVFLDAMWRRYPKRYAMVVLGMATGRRPSELRPLRKSGATPDLIFLPDGTGKLYIRRSHSMGDEVMEKTKTGVRLAIEMPAWLTDVLRWHIDNLPPGPQRDGDLLFPARDGSLLDDCSLGYPFRVVTKEAGFSKHLTPRSLRRSYQDLQRAAQTPDIITRSISGHLTEQMQHHYSTVSGDEQRQALDRMGKLLRFPGGEKGGEIEQIEQAKKASSDGR